LVDQDVDAAPVAVKDPPGAVKCAAVKDSISHWTSNAGRDTGRGE
jgi:hypothetical protein